jgi:hypothetical protein
MNSGTALGRAAPVDFDVPTGILGKPSFVRGGWVELKTKVSPRAIINAESQIDARLAGFPPSPLALAFPLDPELKTHYRICSERSIPRLIPGFGYWVDVSSK